MIDRISNRLKKVNSRLLPGKLLYDPTWIILGVNNVCNLHCKMCDVGTHYKESNFYDHMVGAKPVNMPLELVTRVIDQTAELYPNAKLGYAFTEPSVYPYLVESLEYADSKGLFTSMTTNALMLTKQADALCKAGLDEIIISLDGPPVIHNAIRGNKHSFEKAMEGIEKLMSNPAGKRPRISVFCAITEWNIGHLSEFASLFKHIPLKEMGFMHTVFTTDAMAQIHNNRFGKNYPSSASNMKEINLEQYDLEKLFEETHLLKTTHYPFPVTFSPEITSYEKLAEFYREPEKKIGKICGDAFENLMVKSDGTVIPSHSRCYKISAGNLYERTLKELWNADPIVAFRKDLLKAGGLFPACTRCCSDLRFHHFFTNWHIQ
jgi:MoaA/NifB/PqqE/SkfB family radical SAM enzyme